MICRVCLGTCVSVAEYFDLSQKDEQYYKDLTFLLPNLSLQLTETPLICKPCVQVIKDVVAFKRTCHLAEEKVVAFAENCCTESNRMVLLKDVLNYHSKDDNFIDRDDKEICRSCLGLSPGNVPFVKLDDESSLRSSISDGIITLDFSLTRSPRICDKCIQLSDKLYSFHLKAKEVQTAIENYLEENHALSITNIGLFTFAIKRETDLEKLKQENESRPNKNPSSLAEAAPAPSAMTVGDVTIKEEIFDEEIDETKETYDDREYFLKIEETDDFADLKTINRDDLKTKDANVKPDYIETFEEVLKQENIDIKDDIDEPVPTIEAVKVTKRKPRQKRSKMMVVEDDIKIDIDENPIKIENVIKSETETKDKPESDDNDDDDDDEEKLSDEEYKMNIEYNKVEETSSSGNAKKKKKEKFKRYKYYHCPHCPKKECSKTLLDEHIAQHFGQDKGTLLQCNLCGMTTPCKMTLNKHINSEHPKNNLYHKCTECSFSTMWKSGLKRHMKFCHGDKTELKMFKCSSCDFETRYNNVLKRHTYNKHTPKAKRRIVLVE